MTHRRFGHRDGVRDNFPATGKYIENISKTTLDRTNNKSVQLVLDAIKRDHGEYAIKNQRIIEWVTLQVLTVLLKRKGPLLVNYSFLLSKIEDDIKRHTDAIILAKGVYQTVYFGVDITFSEDAIYRKLMEHTQWSHDITVGNRTRMFLIGSYTYSHEL